MELHGKKFTKQQVYQRAGQLSQLFGAREGVLTAGKADGVRTIDVRNGNGLNFSVLPSRGLDIAWAEYKGTPLAFIGKSGVCHPGFYEPEGAGFLRNFFCGLVTTCGLTHFGAPCVDQGEPLGLHGRYSNIPADQISVTEQWQGDDLYIIIKGRVSQSAVFGENLELTREITVKVGENAIKMKDTIENLGFDPEPFMVLYHCNFGYPIVSENTYLFETPNTNIVARDAEGHVPTAREFQAPTHGYAEQVFYHNFPKQDNCVAGLFNPEVGLGAYLKFSSKEFSHFAQWKMMGEGDYVVGLEPGNAVPEGRDVVRSRGDLEFIQPGEVKTFHLEFGITTNPEETLQNA